MASQLDDAPGNETARPRSSESDSAAIKELEALNQKELTTRDSAYWSDSQLNPYNADDLVQKRWDYEIYEDMVKDDQVSVCLQLKKDLVLGSGFDIITQKSSIKVTPKQKNMPTAPQQQPMSPQQGTKKFQMEIPEDGTEEMPKEDPENPQQEQVDGEDIDQESPEEDAAQEDLDEEMKEFLETVLHEDLETSFEQALEDMLTAYEFGFSITEKVFAQRDDGKMTLKSLKTRHPVTWLLHQDEFGNVTKYEQRAKNTSVEVPPNAIIHYVNKGKFQNPYGDSDLRAAYQAWLTKTHVTRFYAIFLEKAASPTPVGRYDKNAPQTAIDAIFNALKKLQAKTALAIPKELEVEFLEAKNNGDVYVKGINMFNMFIGRSLLIPDLLGFQGSETSGGSYSLGKDQMNVLFKHVQRRQQILEKIINKEIIKPLIKVNFGDVEKYPVFKLRPVSDFDAVEYAKLWLEAVKGKTYKPNPEEINHFRKLVKFPEGEIQEAETPPVLPPAGNAMPGKNPDGSNVPPGQSKSPQENQPQTNPNQDNESASQSPPKKEFKRVYQKPKGDYHKKTNFKMIERDMNKFKDSVLYEAGPVTQQVYDDLYSELRKKKVLKNADLEKITDIKLKHTADLRRLLLRRFKDAYADAYTQAAIEINRKQFKKATVIPADEFQDLLESETWEFIGDWEYQIKKNARIELAAAIKDGKPLSDVIDILDDVGMELSDVQLERYARTKFTEVMNRGRVESFQESGIVAACQYSAILDDRTTEICRGLDGKIFPAGEQPIPPLHFNCRSLLIPITKYEEWESDVDADLNKFIDANIGDGFSRQ